MTDEAPFTRVQAVHSVFWAAFGAVGRYALAGITALILTRLLTPGDFGIIAISIAAQTLIAYIIPIGFHDALIQRPHLDDADLNAAFWSIFILSAGSVLLVIALAPAIARWFDQTILAVLLIVLALVSTFRALDTVPRALLNRRLDFRTLTMARLVGMVIGSVSAITLGALGGGVWSLVVQTTALNLAVLIVLWRAVDWRPGSPRQVTRAALRALWFFAPSVSLLAILGYVINNADDQLIGYRLGPEALGFYALAYSLMAWPARDVLGSVSSVLYPIFARFQDDLPRFHATYLESLQLMTAFAFPTLALITITAPVLIPSLLGPRWTPIVLTTQILALGGLRSSTLKLSGLVFRARGQPHIHTLLQLCSLGPYLVAIVVGLDFGIEGVAFFYVLVGVIFHPVSLWLVLGTARLSWRDHFRALLPTATATLLMSIVAAFALHAARYHWGLASFPALFLDGTLAALVYSGVLLIWSPPGLRRTTEAAYETVHAFALMTTRKFRG